jgi:hypothetical protein
VVETTEEKPHCRQAALRSVRPHFLIAMTSMPGKRAEERDVRINFCRMCHQIFSDIHLEKSDGGQCATSSLVTLKTGLSYSKKLSSKKKHFVLEEYQNIT